MGFGAIRAGGFLPVEAAGVFKTMAGACFRGHGTCTQYDPKVILSVSPRRVPRRKKTEIANRIRNSFLLTVKRQP